MTQCNAKMLSRERMPVQNCEPQEVNNCAVPEKIFNLPTGDDGNSEGEHWGGGGGLKGGNFQGGGGDLSRSLFWGDRELLKTNSCSIEQAFSYFTVSRCFKTRINVLIDDQPHVTQTLHFSFPSV